jgi:hypothetical protein
LEGFKHIMQSLQRQMVNAESSREIDGQGIINSKVKFEIFGEEMLVREVKISGNSGRAYMPPAWVGKQVKIIRID